MSPAFCKKCNRHSPPFKRGLCQECQEQLNERGTTDETLQWCKDKLGIQQYDLDVAASDELHVCPTYYTKADDGLNKPWFGNVWCNPPYDNIAAWVGYAWTVFRLGQVKSISMLLPVRTEQPFWQQMIEPYRDLPGEPVQTHFLPKRTRFKGFSGSPPFSCVLVIWS